MAEIGAEGTNAAAATHIPSLAPKRNSLDAGVLVDGGSKGNNGLD